MAPGLGKNFTRLIKDIQNHYGEYSVFYAIFLCEMRLDNNNPQRDAEKLDQEGLKFRPYENYVYPPSDIRSFSYDGEQIQFVLNFLGLYGINAPLPRCYHEQVAIQQEVHGSGDIPLQNFLDIFDNRFYWLYYQAWKKYRYYLQLSDDPDNKTMQRLFTFIGQIPGDDRKHGNIPPFKLMQLSGLLSNRVRNKKGLIILLHSFFPSLGITVREFVPTMVPLSDLPLLGSQKLPVILSENSIVGHSIMDSMRRIELTIGPISFDEYLDFCTGGEKLRLLNQLMTLYLNDSIEYNINFILSSEGIVSFTFGDSRLKLGRNMWLGKPTEKNVTVHNSHERIQRMDLYPEPQ
ncbi:MAG: type VI secretion system baseplate subunit TssG [Calditrichae bacterium]|nr:type VI secretion system baseplate subunit TssG [Calditrichia bacterium]